MARLKIFLIFIAALIPFVGVRAQTILTPYVEMSGSVPAGGSQTFTFSAQSGAVVSLIAQAESPDLDPILSLSDQAGRPLYSNDDYAYPDSPDALLEAVTLPRTETYTVTVTGFEGSAGDYALTLLPGYGNPLTIEDFSGSDWDSPDDAQATRSSNILSMSVEGVRATGTAQNTDVQAPANFMAQVDVIEVTNPSGWTAGITARRQGNSYYLYEISAQGLWRFSRYDDGTATVLRDWTGHPSILAGEPTFTLGFMANGVGFDFFYNTAYVGSANDATLTEGGTVGLSIGTTSSLASETTAKFDNLVITTPVEVNGARLIPNEIPLAEGTGLVMALKRQNLIAPDGVMSLTLPESSVQFARPGINRLMLGRGTNYTNFALGGTVNMQGGTPSGDVGCGIVFRFTDETHYTLAYIDQRGGYGISERDGEDFLPGLYGTREGLGQGQHHLLIIADDNTLYFYVDRQYVGTVDDPPREGQVGIAVVNFEALNTSCSYSNLWLWEWD